MEGEDGGKEAQGVRLRTWGWGRSVGVACYRGLVLGGWASGRRDDQIRHQKLSGALESQGWDRSSVRMLWPEHLDPPPC